MLHSVFSTALCICMQFLRPAVVIFISVLLNNTSYRMIPFYLLYFILPSQIFFLLSLSLAVFMQYLFQSSSSLCAYVNGLTNIPLAFLFRAVCVNGWITFQKIKNKKPTTKPMRFVSSTENPEIYSWLEVLWISYFWGERETLGQTSAVLALFRRKQAGTTTDTGLEGGIARHFSVYWALIGFRCKPTIKLELQG